MIRKQLSYIMLASLVTTSFAGFVAAPCDSQRYCIQIGRRDPYACGSTSCPSSVKTAARVIDQADLPIDGWFAYYTTDGSFYKSPLRKFEPVKKMSVINGPPMMLSDDGQLVMHSNNKITDLDGNAKTCPAPAHTKRAVWWKGKGNTCVWLIRDNTTTLYTIYAKDINGGTQQTIGEKLSIHYEFFNAAGTHMFTQRKEGSLYNGVLYPIPNNGSGTAQQSDMYHPNPLYTAACGMSMSPDGKLTVGNYDHGNQDCFPTNHKGFAVIPVDKPSGDSTLWMNRTGVSVNFCPADYNGQPLRTGTNAQSQFQNYSWTNKQDWITCIHDGSSTNVYGVWMVHWKTNTWVCLTPRREGELWVDARYAGAFITLDAPLTATPTVTSVRTQAHRGTYLKHWVDMLGRAGAQRAKATSIRMDRQGSQPQPITK